MGFSKIASAFSGSGLASSGWEWDLLVGEGGDGEERSSVWDGKEKKKGTRWQETWERDGFLVF